MLIDEAEDVLEKYVAGKDQNRFEILEEIYKSDARVTFEINSNSISFPLEIHGNREIAQVLSAEFNKKYDNVKTYYLSKKFPRIDNLIISKQRWLVLMREKASNSIRVGTGFYDWKFEIKSNINLKIKHHHICIGVMLNLPDLPLSFLSDLRMHLSYPWVEEDIVIEVIKKYKELNEVKNYLKTRMCRMGVAYEKVSQEKTALH